MQLANLLEETFGSAALACWQRERTANALTGVAVRVHAAGLSLRETAAVLEVLDIDRSHQAIWQWTHQLADSSSDPPSAQPPGVAVDETAVRVNGERCWLYVAIDVESKLLLDIELFGRRGTDPAAAFLHGRTENHDFSEAVFLVDGYGSLTALARLGLSGRLEYTERNHIETWFQTRKQRLDRFYASWVGSRASARRWLKQFVTYYNRQRPHQALNQQTPAQEVLN